jgi:hypothetical protein
MSENTLHQEANCGRWSNADANRLPNAARLTRNHLGFHVIATFGHGELCVAEEFLLRLGLEICCGSKRTAYVTAGVDPEEAVSGARDGESDIWVPSPLYDAWTMPR